MKKQLTDKQYVAAAGLKCPCCRGENIEGQSVDVSGGEAWQTVVCNDCHAAWNDVYKLVGFEILEGASS